MPFNGSGLFTRLYSWVTDAASNVPITASRVDGEDDGFATGLSNCITKDGQTTVIANIPFAGFKITGLGSGTATTDAATVGQLQNNTNNWVSGGGSADAITATYSPAIASLTDGLLLRVRVATTNATTTPTFSPNGLTAHPITRRGGAVLAIGELGGDLLLAYRQASTSWELMADTLAFASASDINAGTITSRTIAPAALAGSAPPWSVAQTMSLAAAGNNLKLTTTDAGATGSTLVIDHNTATPANSDTPGIITVTGKDSGAGAQTWSNIKTVITDVTAASEDAEIRFETPVAGTIAARVNIGGGLYTSGAAGGDKGANTVNASSYYVAGVLMPNPSDSTQSGTTHSPAAADNGKQFFYTNAGAIAVTLPAIAGLSAGYRIGFTAATGAGVITISRSSTDTIWSKNTSLTSIQLQTAGDSGDLIADTANSKWYWRGKRSLTDAGNYNPSVSTDTSTAHNLGVKPDVVRFEIINTSADLNYSANDVVVLGWSSSNSGQGFGATFDDTNVSTKTVNSAITIPNKTSFVESAITTTKWNLRFTATVWN